MGGFTYPDGQATGDGALERLDSRSEGPKALFQARRLDYERHFVHSLGTSFECI